MVDDSQAELTSQRATWRCSLGEASAAFGTEPGHGRGSRSLQPIHIELSDHELLLRTIASQSSDQPTTLARIMIAELTSFSQRGAQLVLRQRHAVELLPPVEWCLTFDSVASADQFVSALVSTPGSAGRFSEDDPAIAAIRFRQRLEEAAPRRLITPWIIAINLAVYAGMTVQGVNPFNPRIIDLVDWGADSGILVHSGDWWRLLTCMFVHVGFIHLGLNMWALYALGRVVERILGTWIYLALYLFSGLAGSAASLVWNPVVVSAGASGAIFGVLGALLGFSVGGRGHVPGQILKGLQRNSLAFVGYNVLFGLMIPGIDNAAHLGGLFSGILLGAIGSRPFDPVRRRRQLWPRWFAVVITGSMIVGAGAAFIAQSSLKDYATFLNAFEIEEEAALTRLQDLLTQARDGRLDDNELAERLTSECSSRWNRVIELGQKVELDPQSPLRRQADLLLKLAKLRGQAVDSLSQGLKQQNEALVKRYQRLSSEADELVNSMAKERKAAPD